MTDRHIKHTGQNNMPPIIRSGGMKNREIIYRSMTKVWIVVTSKCVVMKIKMCILRFALHQKKKQYKIYRCTSKRTNVDCPPGNEDYNVLIEVYLTTEKDFTKYTVSKHNWKFTVSPSSWTVGLEEL